MTARTNSWPVPRQAPTTKDRPHEPWVGATPCYVASLEQWWITRVTALLGPHGAFVTTCERRASGPRSPRALR
jgi:hypothetical protein